MLITLITVVVLFILLPQRFFFIIVTDKVPCGEKEGSYLKLLMCQ